MAIINCVLSKKHIVFFHAIAKIAMISYPYKIILSIFINEIQLIAHLGKLCAVYKKTYLKYIK